MVEAIIRIVQEKDGVMVHVDVPRHVSTEQENVVWTKFQEMFTEWIQSVKGEGARPGVMGTVPAPAPRGKIITLGGVDPATGRPPKGGQPII